MKTWDELTLPEQAAMMKVAVKNGIYDLSTIRQKYNEFAEGGDTDWSYNSWKKQIAEHMSIRPDEDNTYDYEAFFKKYPEEAWRMLKGDPTAHFSDEFKTVYHPTFSSKSVGNDGSIYSGVRNSKTNPQGLVGGTWSPNYHTFTMSPDGYRGPVSMDDRKWYLENAEDNGVVLREANGSLPIYDGIPWGGVLPNVTIYGNKHSIGGPLVEAAMNEYANGGGIHIKPSHRGRLTDLKKRTGKTEAELYRTGSPATRKMITFARNARKWKHGDGGNLFEEAGQMQVGLNVPRIGLDVQGWPNYTTEQIVAYGDENERRRKAIQDAYLNFATESNDATAVVNGRPQNQHLVDKAIQGAKAHAAWEKEHPNLTSWGNALGAAPFVIASIPAVAGAAALGNAGAATSTGKAITAALAPAYSAVTNSSIGGAPLLTWADAGLRSTMLTQGLEDLIKGEFTPETAIELSPAAPAIIRTPGIIRNLQPQEIRNHLYVSKAPVGYEGMGDAIDRWTRGILSGKKADIENPWWLGNSDASIAKQALIKEYAPIPSGVQGTEREQFLEKWSDHALKARTDAWRMHNLIPQKYNTFTPSARHPGAWTDEEGIKMLKWMPAQVEGQAQGDFVSSVGGNIGIPTITRLGNGIPDTGTQLKRFGVTTTSDWFDLQPMSRPNDRLISRLQRYWGSTVSPRTDKVAKKIKDVSDGLRYDSKEIDSWMAANRDDEYAMEMFDPDMFPQSGIKRMIGDGLFGLSKKVAKVGSTPSFKFLKNLDEKLAKMEVGDITGGKPFLVQYDIPWTANTKFLDTGGISTEIVPGFQSENLLPQSVFDWRKGVVRNIEQPNLQYNLGDIDLLNLRLTTKSKKR